MKNILIVGGVSLVLFSVSFALSVWLNASKAGTTPTTKDEKDAKKKGDDHAADKEKDKGHGDDPKKEKEADPKSHEKSAEPKLTAGPKDKDDQTELRRLQMEVVMHDLRLQREEYEKRTKAIQSEIKLLQAEGEVNDTRAKELNQVEQKNKQKEAELKKISGEMEKGEAAGVEKVAGMFEPLEPAKAAEMLQGLADTGKMDLAVKILSRMKAAKASAVLAAIPDLSLGQQLTERLVMAAPKK
jgi:hypothetical protein